MAGAIPETYRLFDEIVGRFLAAVDDDTTVIVLSDHGHAGRPATLVSVNEILRRGGFLVARDPAANPRLALSERAKRMAAREIGRRGLASLAGTAMRRFPAATRAFTRPATIDWRRTLACASDMSGIKSYPYGGIIVNREALGGRDYETTRDEIIALLERDCVLPNGEPLLAFIARREDLYDGPFIGRYPDILLEFRQDYGVGWAVHAPLLTTPPARNIVPGSHRGDTGVFLLRSRAPVRADADAIDLLDVAPTILNLLDLPPDPAHRGRGVIDAATVGSAR